MLVIRLNRTGRKNRAHFRVAVQEKTMAPGGKHIELVGNWDPHKKTAVLSSDRIQYWLGQGAQPSDTVYNLLVSNGIVEGKKRAVKIIRPVKEATETTHDPQSVTNDKKVAEKVEENKEEVIVEEVEVVNAEAENVSVNAKEEVSTAEKVEEDKKEEIAK